MNLRRNNEFIADLNDGYHERALLANQNRFYKRSGHFQKECLSNKTSTSSYPPSNKSSTPSYPSSNKSYNKPKTLTHTSPQNSDNHQKDYKGKYKGLKAKIDVLTKNIDAMSKGKSEKGLVAESFEWDEESVSSEDEGTTKIKAFMAIAEEEPSVGKASARFGHYEKGAAPASTSNSFISLAALTLNMVDLTLNTSVPKKTKPTSNKVSPTHAIKKKTETKSPTIFVPQPEKKAELSIKQLLLTLMDEVKSLKEQIKFPSDNSLFVSQNGSLKSSKAKKAPMIPKPFKECKYYGFNDHHSDNYEYYPGCEV
ncbi:hypothetical protein Tco_0812551 [Tanacetum coccineum]